MNFSILKNKKKFLIFPKKLILLIIILLVQIQFITNKELRFVFELFRHGARSPISLSKENTDIFNNSWKGKGELTEVGMRQHFLLGYRNNKIYANRLKINKFKTKEIFIRSTVLNRTIESAFSQLTGFFPPGTGEVLTNNQIANAYPPLKNVFNFTEEIEKLGINSLPENSNVFPIDNILQTEKFFYLHEHSVCKGVNDLYKNRNNIPNFKNFTIDQAKYLKKIYSIINKTPEEYNLNDYDNCHDLYDSFICGYFDGRKFEDILKNEMTLDEFKTLAMKFLYVDNFYGSVPGEEIGLISMSPLMKKILEKMDNRINIDENPNHASIDKNNLYSSDDPKLYLISGHDTDIGSLMHFMKNVFNVDLIYPEFAASVYLELEYENQNKDNSKEKFNGNVDYSKWTVNFLFNEEKLFTMNFEDFKNKILEKVVDDDYINKFCGFENDNNNDNDKKNPFVIVNIILGSTGFILLVSLIYLSFTKK